MDLTFKVEETCFNYRVGAICKQDNKILILQNKGKIIGMYQAEE